MSQQISIIVDELKELKLDDSAKPVCVKVSNLRLLGYSDLEKWITDPKNLYVGRAGRLWITEANKEKRVYYYPGSIFGNPFKILGELVGSDGKDTTIESCLDKYKQYILNSPELLSKVSALKGKNLGCFCSVENQKQGKCHAAFLAELANKI